jgi:hypothetical protein
MKLTFPQLRSRMQGWLWWSDAAFREALVELPDPHLTNDGLGGIAVEHIATLAHGWSVEQLVGLRREAWKAPTADRSVLGHLRALGRQNLCDHPPFGRHHADNPDPNHLIEQAIAGELPMSMVRRAAGLPGKAPAPALTPPLRGLLERGVAESHSHLGAAQRFDHLWGRAHAAIRSVGRLTITSKEERLFGLQVDHVFNIAAVLRTLLSRWAAASAAAGSPKGVQVTDLATSQGPPVARCLQWALAPQHNSPPAIDSLAVGPPHLFDDVDEESLQTQIWRIRSDQELPDQAETLVAQYLRLYARIWRWVVLDPGVPGLDWFKIWQRHKGLLKLDESKTLLHALESERESANLKSVEWRISPDAIKTRQLICGAVQLLRGIPPEDRPELGFVMHFSKPDDDKPQGADTRGIAWARKAQVKAQEMAELLERTPETLIFLRGVDLCNRELALPLWPTLLPLRTLVRAGQAAHQELEGRARGWGRLDGLRATIHMGEEFHHLQDGLRRLDELVSYGVLHKGDRVGHGLALGTAPARWCAARTHVLCPRGSRLDDLLWEWSLVADRRIRCIAERMTWLEAEILRLASVIYPQEDDLTLSTLRKARDLRHDADRVDDFLNGYTLAATLRAEGLARAWMIDPSFQPAIDEPIVVELHPQDGEVLAALQAEVARSFAAHHITVEANPSSNLIIGGLDELSVHPMFQLQPPAGKSRTPAVSVSINCDNLLVSDTNLAQEYRRTLHALQRRGVVGVAAMDWLEKARCAGMDARFTLPGSRETAPLDWFNSFFPA